MRNDYTIRWLRSALLDKPQNQLSLKAIWGEPISHITVHQTDPKHFLITLAPTKGRIYLFDIHSGQVSYKIGYHLTQKALTGKEVRVRDKEAQQITDTVAFLQQLLDQAIWNF